VAILLQAQGGRAMTFGCYDHESIGLIWMPGAGSIPGLFELTDFLFQLCDLESQRPDAHLQ
jgi:hypothetical protein